MDQTKILNEVKKAIDLYEDDTYDVSAFYSHILSIINENLQPADYHKEQLERMLFKVHELQMLQAKYFSGHKYVLKDCKRLEKELIQKVQYLTTTGGYSIARFVAEKPFQKPLFN